MNQLQSTKQLSIQDFLHVTFSCISYLRDLFNEDCFQTTTFLNTTIKQLKRTPATKTFLDWLEKGCYDAIKRKYLKSISIGIYLKEDMPKRVSEIYSFEINYDKNEIDDSITKLIRTLCLLTQSLQPLPRIKFVTLKLFYYDSVPLDYEPPFFKQAKKHKFQFVSEPLKLEVGKVVINRCESLLRIFTLNDTNKKNSEENEIKHELADEKQHNKNFNGNKKEQNSEIQGKHSMQIKTNQDTNEREIYNIKVNCDENKEKINIKTDELKLNQNKDILMTKNAYNRIDTAKNNSSNIEDSNN